MARIRPLFDAKPQALGAALTALMLSAAPVMAQQVITDNSSIYSNNPNVYIDLGVLDQLGQPASLQSLLSGRQATEAGYPQLTLPSQQKLKLKAPAKPVVASKPKPKPVVETVLAEPTLKAPSYEPISATPAPKTPVETAPAAPMPPAPPKIAEAPSAPTPIAKAPEAPKPPSVPAPPSIEAKQVTPTPPSVPEINRPTETASLPDAAAPSVMESGETLMQVVFADGATRIPDNKLTDLKALAGRMSKDEDIRLQLLAYAEGTDANASKARRLSLSRALAVRSYLIDQGVRSTRIDVRALGNKAGSGPAERVDVVMMKK
ncbi:putative Lysophospholipase [Rhodospirillaceae bacterium LM-1]|nr:putative Lysophospholipase [Rhodospirillaceae bacterium LM-1]